MTPITTPQSPPVVDISIAKMFVQVYLSPLNFYRPEGIDTLAEALQVSAISVQHAEATVKQFEHDCPTPKEIKDAAFALREKFEPKKPSLVEQWKAEGCTNEPLDLSYYRELMQRHREPGEPTTDELMWRAIGRRLKVKDYRDVPIGKCWFVAGELGFPLNSYQQEKRDHWLSTASKEEIEKCQTKQTT